MVVVNGRSSGPGVVAVRVVYENRDRYGVSLIELDAQDSDSDFGPDPDPDPDSPVRHGATRDKESRLAIHCL